MNCIWLDGSKGFKNDMDFADIDAITHKLIDEENKRKENDSFKSISLNRIFEAM